jgi:Fe-S-cluster containining protein
VTCTRCGACCQDVHLVNLPAKPGTTVCLHLLEDNSCAIYDERPEVCRVTNWEETVPACNWLQELKGIDKKFRLEIVK